MEKYIIVTGLLPVITVDFSNRTLGNIFDDVGEVSDTFFVYNSSKGPDSVFVSLDYNNITSGTGLGVSPEKFELAPSDSQAIIFTVYPALITPVNRTVIPKVFIDSQLNAGQKHFIKSYQFRVRVATPVEEENILPEEFILSQNYPNPFNPSTTIQYSIPVVEAMNSVEVRLVTLRVYDILGLEVAALVNEHQRPGNYKVKIDASNLSSGVYFYTLKAGSNIATKKMLLLR